MIVRVQIKRYLVDGNMAMDVHLSRCMVERFDSHTKIKKYDFMINKSDQVYQFLLLCWSLVS